MPSGFHIENLLSGGLITNYDCTSLCRHCLYNCGPHREQDYIEEETIRESYKKIRTLRCPSIHIGGGEPFLNISGLKTVLEIARQENIRIEYVETNSSWYTAPNSARKILESLKQSGLTTLLISISPFHNEHIAFWKVKGVIKTCEELGISIFPWMLDFYKDIESFDEIATHGLSEYEKKFGQEYLSSIRSRYWVHLGGRAVKLFEKSLQKKDPEAIMAEASGGCVELVNTDHFHLDLYGNYIPGFCSGLAIQSNDLGNELVPERYPILCTLFAEGIQGFFDFAQSRYGFTTQKSFVSKCHLCLEIRSFLVNEKNLKTHELQPKGFYATG